MSQMKIKKQKNQEPGVIPIPMPPAKDDGGPESKRILLDDEMAGVLRENFSNIIQLNQAANYAQQQLSSAYEANKRLVLALVRQAKKDPDDFPVYQLWLDDKTKQMYLRGMTQEEFQMLQQQKGTSGKII